MCVDVESGRSRLVIRDNGRGFDQEDNTLHVFWKDGDKTFATAPKTALARQLIHLIAKEWKNNNLYL